MGKGTRLRQNFLPPPFFRLSRKFLASPKFRDSIRHFYPDLQRAGRRRALFTIASGERKPDTTMLTDQYSVLTLGAFIDGYLLNRDDDGLMSAAPPSDELSDGMPCVASSREAAGSRRCPSHCRSAG